MKSALKIITGILLSLFVLFTVVNWVSSRELKTDILIDASAEEVWSVLLAHEAYPDWNPFITEISGPVRPGENLTVTMQLEGNAPMKFIPRVLVNEENKEFRWRGKMGVSGIFDGEHYFSLEKIDTRRTRFIQGEKFSGILSGLFMLMIREDTEQGFVAMNMALKNRVESER